MRYSLEQILDLEGEAELVSLAELSLLDSSFCLRARRRGLKLSEFVVDAKGKIDREKLKILEALFQKEGFVLYPLATVGINDAELTFYIKGALHTLLRDAPLCRQIESLGFPLCNGLAEEFVKDSVLSLSPPTERTLRCALVSALFTPLQQSVGSCFATAPAILVQEKHLPQLAADLVEILSTGSLKRVVQGQEFSVPMSPTAGSGDLKKKIDPSRVYFSPSLLSLGKEFSAGETIEQMVRGSHGGEELRRLKARFVAFTLHPLLKMWEFTLASLSDVKMEFSRFSLYTALGFDPRDEGGIGQLIYEHLDLLLQKENQETERYHEESIIAQEQLRLTETLLRQAGSEREARRLQAEHQSRLHQFYACLDRRDSHAKNGQMLSEFFSFLLQQYDLELPHHFQEIYDAEMGELLHDTLNDSPAGFRLACKHGRARAHLWSFIYTKEQYVDALRAFFLSTEALITSRLEQEKKWPQSGKILSEITTKIVHHLQSEAFILSAFKRVAQRRAVSASLTPWAYDSGGTMPTLLKTYFRKTGTLPEESCAAESPVHLSIFFVDLLKLAHYRGRLLMYSPVHACSLLTESASLKRASEARLFTYSYIRDTFIEPAVSFYEGLLLSPAEQRFLEETARLSISGSRDILSVKQWRSAYPKSPSLDAFLFSALPLLSAQNWKEKAHEILEELGEKKALIHIKEPTSSYLTRVEIYSQLSSALCYGKAYRTDQKDLHEQLMQILRRKKLAPPEPLLPDTNWPKWFFAFLVSPSSGVFELWRIDRLGLLGEPMHEWQHYVDGTSKEKWGVYTLNL